MTEEEATVSTDERNPIASAWVTCPRCAVTQPASRIKLHSDADWFEYLSLDASGRIAQQHFATSFELADCGDMFRTDLWDLRVRYEASTSSPGRIGVFVEKLHHDQPPDIHPDSTDLPDARQAAVRVEGFISAWGDGVIDEVLKGNHKLYARDLVALTAFVTKPETRPVHPLPEAPAWKPGEWWRVLAPDGSVWCETSSEFEARAALRPNDLLQRDYIFAGGAHQWVNEPRIEEKVCMIPGCGCAGTPHA